MSKTCQLCGKPLGRRGDGEFCSSEHRNQFRLRRGMDRLEEANKVASLMRRRENLRQIPVAQLGAAGALQPRGSGVPAAFPVRNPEPRLVPLQPILSEMRISHTSERFANPLSALSQKSSAAAKRFVEPAVLPLVSRKNVSPVPALKEGTRPAAGVMRAGLTSIRRGVPAGKGEGRSCGAALCVSRRTALPGRKLEPELSAATSLEKTRRLQELPVEPTGATAVESRAYPGFEFEKRRPKMRGRPRSVSAPDGLPGSQPKPGTEPEIQDVASISRDCDIPRLERTPRYPRLRAGNSVDGTRQAGALRLIPAAYDSTHPVHPSECVVSWEPVAAVCLPGPMRVGVRAGMSGTANPVSMAWACDAVCEHRPAEVLFIPTDSTFDHSPMELQGTFASTAAGTARVGHEVIEEHFDASLDQWTGDLMDWKLDVAGARPAGLALLKPTITLGDYEFEFFTRIENRAVTFAFRAANVSNYFKVAIAMADSGRYELRRCAVIGGIEEAPAVAPLPSVLRAGAAFTVKVNAWQNDFSVWLDGELAARWTDGRLPTGGIGFMAPRDDRARVYWVRLSQIEGPNSQAATHRPVRSIQ